jgi:DNA-binding MarR family transcriptional regulator
VERSEAPADRRVKRLVLTEAGRNLIEQGIAARSLWIENLAKALNPKQQEQVIAALELLTEAAQQTEE